MNRLGATSFRYRARFACGAFRSVVKYDTVRTERIASTTATQGALHLGCLQPRIKEVKMEHKLQGIRSLYQDYREPSFYMVTMTTWQRMPLLATCHDNASFPTEVGHLVEALWRDIPRTYPQVEVLF